MHQEKTTPEQSLAAFCRPQLTGTELRLAPAPTGHVSVFAFDSARPEATLEAMPYVRRDFYKISLYTSGTSHLRHAGLTWLIDRPALVFCNLLQPYTCNPQTPVAGFCCLFTESFLGGLTRTASLLESPLFRLDANPLFFLPSEQFAAASQLFRQMQADAASDYRHKDELVRTQLQLLIHEALRQRPEAAQPLGASAANRLAAQFLQLLEQQFPITSPAQPLRLRTPQAFAESLHIHVNHLNRVVREATGKTTSAHLAERILHEAQTLLRHTAWPTTDIAYGLGFTEPTGFHHFFKKHGGVAPKLFRQPAAG